MANIGNIGKEVPPKAINLTISIFSFFFPILRVSGSYTMSVDGDLLSKCIIVAMQGK